MCLWTNTTRLGGRRSDGAWCDQLPWKEQGCPKTAWPARWSVRLWKPRHDLTRFRNVDWSRERRSSDQDLGSDSKIPRQIVDIMRGDWSGRKELVVLSLQEVGAHRSPTNLPECGSSDWKTLSRLEERRWPDCWWVDWRDVNSASCMENGQTEKYIDRRYWLDILLRSCLEKAFRILKRRGFLPYLRMNSKDRHHFQWNPQWTSIRIIFYFSSQAAGGKIMQSMQLPQVFLPWTLSTQ
jgi:hypothetical protein